MLPPYPEVLNIFLHSWLKVIGKYNIGWVHHSAAEGGCLLALSRMPSPYFQGQS